MARTTPTLRETTLLFSEEGQEILIVVGSEQWFEWVHKETSTIFSFHSLNGSYTARKESAGNRRGEWYWKAYRKHQGTLYHAYLGKPEGLTLARLNEIALALSARIQEQTKPARDVSEAERRPDHEMQSNPTATPLLETKLHPPRLPALLVERAHLLTLLDTGQKQKLTLLHAPAGFGKTTLVTQWIAHRQAQAAAAQRSPAPVAWISLDSGDNDPIRFWSSVITSCQTFHEHLGQTALVHLFQSSRVPFAPSPLETALTFLLNDLSRFVQEGVLILEDYHLIEHAHIHETLAFFIEHLPVSLHVAILTRSMPPLPLVRWRARGDLLEVHPAQLRFSPEETATFLQQVIPYALSESALRSLHTQFEGWAAGLRLFALSLQSQVTPQAIEDALKQLSAGSTADRAHRPIQEFFLSEVLSAQPESLQLFLLQTSMLSRLTSSLCNAVTGRQDSAEWLEVVECSGFFLEALDSTGEWYRYHALFAEAMRAEAGRRLGEEALRGLSALASRWYEEHAMLGEAIEAALSAQEFARAAHLIERLNERAYFSQYHTMRRWLEQLPEPLLRTHPALCFLFAQARLFSENSHGSVWRIEPVEDLLQMAEEGWRAQGDLFQVGILYAFRATFTVVHGFTTPAVAYAHQALQLLQPAAAEHTGGQRPAEWIEWHCGCLMTLSMEATQAGSFDKAQQHLLEAYALSLNVEDRVFTRVIGRMLGDVCLELGELHRAASYYQQTLSEPPWPDESGEALFRAQFACGLIRLSYEWNELEKAERLAREASLYTYRGDFPLGEADVRTKVELLRLLLLHTRGEVAEVQAALSALFVRLQAIPHTLPLILDVLTWQARLQIRDSDLAAAEHTLGTLANSEKELSPLQQQALHLLQARLHLARGEAETALPLLEQLLACAQQGKHIIRVVEIQLLTALAHAALKHGQKVRHQLSLILSQTRNEGFLRLFLDEGEPLAVLLRGLLPSLTEKPLRAYAQSILRAFTDQRPVHASSESGTALPLLEPLSAQEQRVLTLLVAGRSNPEIAQELIISINTVKGHVKNLYRKLDVNNRVEVGEAARRFKLL